MSPRHRSREESLLLYLPELLPMGSLCIQKDSCFPSPHWISGLVCHTMIKIISFLVGLKERNFSVLTYLKISLISLLIGSGILGYKVILSENFDVISSLSSCIHILPVKHDVNLVLFLCVVIFFFPLEAFRIFELQIFHQSAFR